MLYRELAMPLFRYEDDTEATRLYQEYLDNRVTDHNGVDQWGQDEENTMEVWLTWNPVGQSTAITVEQTARRVHEERRGYPLQCLCGYKATDYIGFLNHQQQPD